MATKTIISTRTLHVPSADYRPIKIDPVTGGHLEAGNYAIDEIKPGTSVKLDEKEADRLLTAHPDWFELAPAESQKLAK